MSETDRLRSLKDLNDNHEDGWEEYYLAGESGCHEAFTTLSVSLGLLSTTVLEHPSIVLNSEWYAGVEEGIRVLSRVYSKLSEEHLGLLEGRNGKA